MPWDLIKEKKFKVFSIWANRGCPWGRCKFCSIKTKPGRRLSVENVIRILKEAKENCRFENRVGFYDALFIQNRKWVMEFCKRMCEEGLNEEMSFSADLRINSVAGADYVDKEILKIMKSANLTRPIVGLETMLPERAEYLGKCIDGEEYVKTAKNFVRGCLDIGITPLLNIMTISENSTFDEVTRDLLAISKLLKEMNQEFIYTPVVGITSVSWPVIGCTFVEEKKDRIKFIGIPLKVNEEGDITYLKYPKEFVMREEIRKLVYTLESKREQFERNGGYYPYIKFAVKYIKKNSKNKRIRKRCDGIIKNVNSVVYGFMG